ncbi:MAG: glycoside hydrolase family 2 protein [Candidatus Bathyarchaeota archaeon]|nr:glycoside hydrolase family 2 protein [Candidatus Bathyarchaeota archaeon]
MAVYSYSLDGRWLIKGFPKLNGEGEGVYDPCYPVDGWVQAEVPGVVHLDLIRSGVIPDPFYGLNEDTARWVEDIEWWYRKDFEPPDELLGRECVELIFEGLDTIATIWVNGVRIGEAYNMFTPWVFDVKNILKPGRNTVVVRFKPPGRYADELSDRYSEKYGVLNSAFHRSRPYVRKAQYSFGWDWGPRLPTVGIWRSVKLIGYDVGRLGYVAALPLEVSEDKAILKLTAEVYAYRRFRARVRFTVEGYGSRVEAYVEDYIEPGRNDLSCLVELDKPRLWWPNGYGDQNLYKLTVGLYSEDSILDEAYTRIGIRRVELIQEPNGKGRSFLFKINGLPVFCKGANWIPADSFLPRVSRERYRRLLEMAREAGMNMLRVWGGGIYEDDYFYDLCDELGIMVWQDFMYACAEYPEEDWFLREAEREAEEVVRRLRGHPCIVLWCGNNENQWIYYMAWRSRGRLLGSPIYDEILPRVCVRLDPTRPYQPSSPYGGEDPNSPYEGDRHNWDVWSGWYSYERYLDDEGRFISEFGWQAPPTLKVIRRYIGSDVKPYSRVVEAHEKQTDGIERLYRFLSAYYPVPDDLRLFTLYCQLNQGEALREGIEHWRSLTYKTSGCLVWQLNDCWPALSWSLVDYDLNPKPSYYFVKRAFKPRIVSMEVRGGRLSIHIVNESPEDLDGTLLFYVMDFHGVVYYSEYIDVRVPRYSSSRVIERMIDKLPIADCRVFAVKLIADGRIVYEDARMISKPKHVHLPKPRIEVHVSRIGDGSYNLLLESDAYVKGLALSLEDMEASFEDNYFDLIPRSAKGIRVHLSRDIGVEDFLEKLRVEVYPYTETPNVRIRI